MNVSSCKKSIYLDKDTSLMLKATDGDEKAFEKLYSKYFPVVTSFITRLSGPHGPSEDLAQKVFALIWEKKINFRAESSVKTYLLAIARNILSEHRRKKDKEANARKLWISNHDSLSSNPRIQAEFSNDEVIENIKKAKDNLTAKQLRAVELIYTMKLPSKKAAELSGCTLKAFEKRLARANKRLRQVINEYISKNVEI